MNNQRGQFSKHAVQNGLVVNRGGRFGSSLIAAMLMLTGCGGSDDGSQSSGAAGASHTQIASVAAVLEGTTHPLVARLNIPAVDPGSTVEVEFGINRSYGRSTPRAVVTSGAATILVAGMQARSGYHIRAKVVKADGSTHYTQDFLFNTGVLPDNLASVRFKAETAPGKTLPLGVELISSATGPHQPYAVDLRGNIIWYYPWTDYEASFTAAGVEQMANGNFITTLGQSYNLPVTGTPDPTKSLVREFNLLGETVKQVTISELNAKLAMAGNSITLGVFHHHVEVLPNGHWLLLANTVKVVDGLPVLGDVIIDIDADMKPVWVWNSFDHMDVNRRPMELQDWTHGNAVVYSPTDGNLLISLRHQHWVLKVNYQNGAGDGAVIWRLGKGGDFTLINGSDPTDWQYAQHFPVFVGPTSAGKFDLSLMDNGTERIGTDGLKCGTQGAPACYTTMPLFRIDEQARTATILSRVTLPPNLFSAFGGNGGLLANGNFEYNLCAVPSGAVIQERTPDDSHALVWSLTNLNGHFIYRGFRMQSLYPGVTWN